MSRPAGRTARPPGNRAHTAPAAPLRPAPPRQPRPHEEKAHKRLLPPADAGESVGSDAVPPLSAKVVVAVPCLISRTRSPGLDFSRGTVFPSSHTAVPASSSTLILPRRGGQATPRPASCRFLFFLGVAVRTTTAMHIRMHPSHECGKVADSTRIGSHGNRVAAP